MPCAFCDYLGRVIMSLSAVELMAGRYPLPASQVRMIANVINDRLNITIKGRTGDTVGFQ